VVDLIHFERDVFGHVVSDEFETGVTEELLDVALVARETVCGITDSRQNTETHGTKSAKQSDGSNRGAAR
jgi:hypothetical protein